MNILKPQKKHLCFSYKGNDLFSKSGSNLAIFHPQNQQPLVTLQDTDGDGRPDRIDYEVYDSEDRYLGTSSDYNLDGQTDLKISVIYNNGTAEASSSVWVENEWHQLHEKGRDSGGLVKRFISINNEWVKIDISKHPFKLGI